ncbi:MAG: hypothetical protein H0W99_10205, partial [Acidobacteria bacterium]|nr:hypothetical protein [Acidobacteriota bacterium]
GVNGPDDLLAAEGPEFVLSLISEAQDKEERSGRNKNQATVLIELAESAELFHTPEGEAYASIKANGHSEVWPLKSKGFKDYLMRLFYRQEKSAPNAQAMQDALGVLNGKARYDGPTYEVHTRLCEHEGAIYLDLCDEQWRVVRITSEGWDVLNDSPVKFRRTRGMLALPVPIRGGSVHELKEFVNVKDEDDFILLLGWLIAALRGGARNFPILDITGEQGSAKTTTSRVCRALIDPNKAAVRSAPRDEQDLSIAANNGWIIALDNLSSLQQWKSDALCRLSTGGGFATRELYSNDDETIFDATRPILLNGIEDVATRPDLLDRTVILQLPEITEERRLKEKDFWERFETTRPQILGALLDCVACALKNLSSVKLERSPRMADFAQWATAAEPAMNVEPSSFINAYLQNRSAANEWALEASPVAMTLLSLMGKRGGWTWTVTLKQLLTELNNELGDGGKKPDDWPKSERGLAGALTRCAPNLRKAGWSITDPKREAGTGRSRRIITRLENTRKSPSQSPQSSQANENGHDNREDVCEDQEQPSLVSSQGNPNETAVWEGYKVCEDEIPSHSEDEAFAEVSAFFSKVAEVRLGAAIWHNSSGDQPIVIVGDLGEVGGRRYVEIEGSTAGIPFDEVEYETIAAGVPQRGQAIDEDTITF